MFFFASIGISLSGSIAASSFQVSSPLLSSLLGHKFNSDQPYNSLIKKDSYSEKKIIFSQNAKDPQSRKNQSNVDKETKREERNLEREAKKTCDISYERRNGKKKKCEPSVYEQALPGIDFERTDDKIIDEMTRELQRELKSQNSIIVK